MYLITHALKNIMRNKERYLLIGAVLIICLISITVSAMIHFTTKAVINDYSDRFSIGIYFTPDLRKLFALTKPDENRMYHNPEITSEQYIAFSKSAAVKNTLFQGSHQTYSDKLVRLNQGGEKNFYASGGWEGFQASADSQTAHVQRQAPNTVILSYSDYSLMKDFAQRLRKLDERSFFKASKECMMSREFADLNDLKLSDRLKLQDVNTTEVTSLQLTICEIYLNITTPQPEGGDWAVNNQRNEILTSFSTLKEHSTLRLNVTAVYYLKNPGLTAEFESYVRENGLHEVYHVNVNAESYYQIIKPVEGLKRISTAFLMVILLVRCLILILLSILEVRERKYEISVLHAMGMQKEKVTFGLICKSVCIMLLCLDISLSASSFITQPVSNMIMKEQEGLAKQYPQENYEDIISNTIGTNETASALQEVEIILTPESVICTFIISLALGLLSNIAGIFYITRYEPMKILTERG